MRVILLTHGGADLVIRRLAALDGVSLVGVFIETATTPKRSLVERIKRSIKYDGLRSTLTKVSPIGLRNKDTRIVDADLTRQTAAELGVPVVEIGSFHSSEAIDKLRSVEADLAVIFGTNIIKEQVFTVPRMGSINLHQGFAPHYRGGPPIFWELFNGESQVGLTAHFVAREVDTGDIILQKLLPLEYDASYGTNFERFIDDFRFRIRDDSAALISDAVAAVAGGNFEQIQQDVSVGKRYRLPTKNEKDEMRRRLRFRLQGSSSE